MAQFAARLHCSGRLIGPGCPCFIIAEAGVNHNGDIDLARRLVRVAADAGADAVKFQTFKAERVASASAPKAAYQQRTTAEGESQLDMLRRLELSVDAHRELQQLCHELNVVFISTPFDEESADLLDSLNVPLYKLPSGEVTNHRLLSHVAAKKKPIILSTGMCSLGEVEQALNVLAREGTTELVLLHTVSNYPAEAQDVNLRAMDTLAHAFGCPVGYSDHTLGIAVATAAVARGAVVIEKHLTLDRNLPGPDHRASAEPHEFGALVAAVRAVEKALGDGRKVMRDSEQDVARVARRSIVLARDLPKGTRLTMNDLVFRRPGLGLPPPFAEFLIGRQLRTDCAEGTVLSLDHIV